LFTTVNCNVQFTHVNVKSQERLTLVLNLGTEQLVDVTVSPDSNELAMHLNIRSQVRFHDIIFPFQ